MKNSREGFPITAALVPVANSSAATCPAESISPSFPIQAPVLFQRDKFRSSDDIAKCVVQDRIVEEIATIASQ